MKMCASTPARAAYAASAPPALPALGTASFVAPRYFAIETATLIPRALKLCVGLSDSSLIQRSTSSANFAGCATMAFRLHLTRPAQHRVATAKLRDNAIMIFPASSSVSRVRVRLAAARSTIANSGLLQEPQRFCSRDHSCSRPHALHSRRFKNIGAMERTSGERTRGPNRQSGSLA